MTSRKQPLKGLGRVTEDGRGFSRASSLPAPPKKMAPSRFRSPNTPGVLPLEKAMMMMMTTMVMVVMMMMTMMTVVIMVKVVRKMMMMTMMMVVIMMRMMLSLTRRS